MNYNKKYKALILKYVPYISKYMPYIFRLFRHLKHNNLQKPQNQHQKRPRNEVNSDVLPHILSVSPGILSAITFAIYAVIQPYPLSAHRIRTLRKRLFLIFAPTFYKHETEKVPYCGNWSFPDCPKYICANIRCRRFAIHHRRRQCGC